MGRCKKCGKSLTAAEMNSPCPDCGEVDRIVGDVDRFTMREALDVDTAAESLARRHYEIEPGLVQIFRIDVRTGSEADCSPVIRLLEVNENTPESGVMPLYFGPARSAGVLYPSVIIEVSPEEFQRIEAEELRLPEGWVVGQKLDKPLLAKNP